MNKIYVIAEAGVNHNGNIEIAKEMVDRAVEAGADAVKFQTFKADKLVCKKAEKAAYQKAGTAAEESQYEMLKKLELSERMHMDLMEYCDKKRIRFLSTPFDTDSLRLLVELGIPIIKIPSGEITNLPYLKAVARTGKEVLLSTGMSSLAEVREAVWLLKKNGTRKITVLHCNTQYPTPMEDVNLNAMLTIRNELHVPVGYSDHSEGIEVAIAAAALGAEVIEKHFTLDRGMEGPDHKASMEPSGLKQMIKCIRNIEKALGSSEKKAGASERENLAVVRKSIVAAKNIHSGEVFSEDNLTVKRPGTGISPMNWYEVIGKRAEKDYMADEIIII